MQRGEIILAFKSNLVHDPNKITLRFLFAGRDGINVIYVIDCKLNETVGGVKGALMSVWPEGELVLFAKMFIVWWIVSGINLYLLPLVFNYMLYALTSKTAHTKQ
jgi:hypothetical protein